LYSSVKGYSSGVVLNANDIVGESHLGSIYKLDTLNVKLEGGCPLKLDLTVRIDGSGIEWVDMYENELLSGLFDGVHVYIKAPPKVTVT